MTETTRPDNLDGKTIKVECGYGNVYVTVNDHEGKPFEVFCTLGKSGRELTAHTEAVGRMISLALRCGADIKKVISQLRGIGGEKPLPHLDVLSIPDAIAKALEIYLEGK